MHRFIDAEPLAVRPRQDFRKAPPLTDHLLRPHDRRELDESRIPGWLEPAEQIAKRKSHPRNDHRPFFDTAHAIHALFERMRTNDIFQGVAAALRALARDLDGPRRGIERVGIANRIVFVLAVLVEIVVLRHRVKRRERVCRRHHLRHRGQLAALLHGTGTNAHRDGGCRNHGDELATTEVQLLRRHLR